MNKMIKETIETALTQLSHQVLQEDAPETRKTVSILKAKGYHSNEQILDCIKTTLAELTYYALTHTDSSIDDLFYYKLMEMPPCKNNFSGIDGKKTYFIFEAWLNGYKDKMYRKFKLPAEKTLNELAYTILTTFHLEAEHTFAFTYQGETYFHEYQPDFPAIPANHVRLKDLNFDLDPSLEMTYDLGCCYNICIKYLDMEIMDKRILRTTPVILEGIGNGLVENQKSELVAYLNGNDMEIDLRDKKVKFSYMYPFITQPFDLKKNQYLTQGRFPLYKDLFEHLK